MSLPSSSDSRFDRAAASDDSVLSAHEQILAPHGDDKAHYPLLPLGMLFMVSGFILFAATYLNRYSGHFDKTVFNEDALPTSGPGVSAPIDPVAMGKRLFNSGGACVTCHQANGQGIPGVYPPLAGSEWAQGPEARVIRILLDGLKGPVTVEGKTFGASVMPAFGPHQFNWSSEKISQVLTYVRQEWGNKGGPITAAQVEAVAAQIGDHAEWSSDELTAIK